ncbi:MAG TPA: thioredoxin-like domain-containing protein [Gemmatimonadaceae bacterium]
MIPVIAASAVLILGIQNRALRQRNRDLIVRFTAPHPGMLVPAFTARSLVGDSVTIGASSLDERQVLFFFTSTCPYCVRSMPALRLLDSLLRREHRRRAPLIAVSLDSAGGTHGFADSVNAMMPVVVVPSERMRLLYRVRSIPQLMVLDSGGRTVYARTGELTGSVVRDSVAPAIWLGMPVVPPVAKVATRTH